MTRVSFATLVAALLTLGCASQPGGKPLTPLTDFPAKAELDAIAKRPPPKVQAPDVAAGDGWELPAREESPDAAPWREALREAGGPKVELSEDLDCVAEQVARFATAHAGAPDARLLSYMAARCGVANAGLRTNLMRATGSGSLESLIDVWRPALEERLPKLFAAAATSGAWLHRTEDRAALALVHAGQRADVRLGAIEDGRVRVEGTLRVPAKHVVAYVNRGAHGVAPCDVEPAAPPTFAVVCALDPGDDQTMVEIFARVPDHLLLRLVANAVVHREGPEAITVPPLPPAPADLLAGINAARKAAERPALVLEPAQSRANAALAPHFFAAIIEDDVTLLERISLGLIAGHDVSTTIGDAHFLGDFAHRQSDPGRWLAEALERPRGRIVLLAPDVDRVAIGPARDEPTPGFGAIVTTYRTFARGIDEGDDLALVKAALDQARAKRQRAPVELLPAEALDEVVKEIQAGEPVEDALLRAAEEAQSAANGQVYSVHAAAIRLDQITFPDALLDMHGARAAIKVVRHHVPPSKWGFYLVLMLVVHDRSAPRTASLAVEPARL